MTEEKRWEDIIKAKTTNALGENTTRYSDAYFDNDITQKDIDNMREALEDEITDAMASILNEYTDVGASNDSFHMPTVSEGLKKIFEAMIGYIEGSDMTIEGKK